MGKYVKASSAKTLPQKTPDIYLRVPGEVRDKVTAADKKHVDEQRAERDRVKAEADAAKRVEREVKEREQETIRERAKLVKRTADIADRDLQVALDAYREVERAVKPEERENARQAAAEALRKMNSGAAAMNAARERFYALKAEHERKRAEFDKLMVHVHAEVPAAKVTLLTAWDACEAAWKAAPTPYTKEHRDRRLKNVVKDVLGLTSDPVQSYIDSGATNDDGTPRSYEDAKRDLEDYGAGEV